MTVSGIRSLSGAIVVLAGALVFGLAHDEIPEEALSTILGFGLTSIGLFVFLTYLGDGQEKES